MSAVIAAVFPTSVPTVHIGASLGPSGAAQTLTWSAGSERMPQQSGGKAGGDIKWRV